MTAAMDVPERTDVTVMKFLKDFFSRRGAVAILSILTLFAAGIGALTGLVSQARTRNTS